MNLSDVLSKHAETAQKILDRVIRSEQEKREAIMNGCYLDMIEHNPHRPTAFFFMNQYAVLHSNKSAVDDIIQILGDIDIETETDTVETMLEKKFLTGDRHDSRFQPRVDELEHCWHKTLDYICVIKAYNNVTYRGIVHGSMFYFADQESPALTEPDHPLVGAIQYGPGGAGGAGNDWVGFELSPKQQVTLKSGPAILELVNDSRSVNAEFRVTNA